MASGSDSRGRLGGAGVGVGVLSSPRGRGGRLGAWASSSKTLGGF